MKSTLASLLQTWNDRRQPEIADLAEAVTAALLEAEPRPALGASKKAAERYAWREVAARRDSLDFPRLMAAARGGSQIDVKLQVQYLSSWNHPSLARGLLVLLEDPPYAGIKSRPMLEEIFEALENTRDVRLAKPARALAKRYLAIVNSSTGGWIVSELERIAKAVEAFSPPELSADERLHYDGIWQSLPPAHRPRSQTTESSGPSIEVLLEDVYKHPDDDERRLTFAQALRDENDERSEFIQLQIAEARGTLTPEQAARLKTIAKPDRLAGWAQPLSLSGACEFARGFPVAINLYKTAMQSLGEPAWATIERVDGIEKISQKAAREFLDHPSLANVKGISSLNAKVLAAIDNRVRLWKSLTLFEDETLDTHLLRRCPELRELTLWLRGGRATRERQLLSELVHLQKLDLRLGRTTGSIAVNVPSTVTEATVHGELAPGIFAHASNLEKLLLWPPRLLREHLEGLAGLKCLDVRADDFGADAFEAVPGLTTLTVSKPGTETSLPERLFYPLRELKHLDLMYARVGPEELAPLQQLEEVRHYWTNVEDVPKLPRLSTFHCMLPNTVDKIERLLRRNPTIHRLEFCWNSGSVLWFSSEPGDDCERAWKDFGEVLSNSSIESWASDNKVRIIRQGNGWRLEEMKEKISSYDWGFPRFLWQVVRTFGISVATIPPALREHIKRWL